MNSNISDAALFVCGCVVFVLIVAGATSLLAAYMDVLLP
jgi:hypothetical protein